MRNGFRCQGRMDSGDYRNRDSCDLVGGARGVASLQSLSMAQGLSRDGGDILDGRNVIPSSSLRLPLRSRDRLAPIRDVQSDGTAAAARDHQPRYGGQLDAWAVDGLRWCLDLGTLVAVQAASCRRTVRPSRHVSALDP